MIYIGKRKRELTPMHLFTSISLFGTGLFLVYSVIFGHISFRWLCMANKPEYMFLDYFKHVLFTADPAHLYEKATGVWGCFPPFIYMVYHLMYRMTAYMGLTPEYWVDLMYVDEALTVFLYYSVFVAVAMLLAIQLRQKKSGSIKLYTCLIMSAPFFSGFERGNSVVLVFVLLLYVLKWRDDESRVKREIAMILIAVCAAIKIYPAIFGFLYIKDKRYNEGFRLLGYGVLLFFVPFLFFGGFNGFMLWLSNVSDALVSYSIGRVECIRGLVMTVSYFSTGETADYLALVLPNIFLIMMLGLFFITASQYRTVFYLCAIMTFYPSNAFRYTLCYLAIPLVMFLMEHGDEKLDSNLLVMEMIGFGLLFTVPTLYGLLTNFNGGLFKQNERFTYVELRLYIAAYSVMGMIVIHELIDVFKNKRFNENLNRRVGKQSA